MIKRGLVIAALFGLFLVLAVACGGGGPLPTPTATPTPAGPPPTPTTTPPPAGDLVALGRHIYTNLPDNAAPQDLWCYQCHTIEGVPEAEGLIGPDHTHIGRDAIGRIQGLSAEEYLRQSILDPPAHVAPDVVRATEGLMIAAITEKLTPDQVDALVAFLLTLQ